jgi:hypothetical protein
MIPRHPIILKLVLVAGCAAALAACGSNSGTGAGPAATGIPIARPPSGAFARKGTILNLAPDPDTLRTWEAGSFSRGTGGPGGAADLEMLGTGKPVPSVDLYSPPITLRPGKTYTFSMWIDPSQMIDGYGGLLGIYAPSRLVEYAQVRIIRGPAGRYFVSAAVPKDQSKVRLDFQPNGYTLATGRRLKIAQPMLVVGTPKPPAVVPKPHPSGAPKTHATASH